MNVAVDEVESNADAASEMSVAKFAEADVASTPEAVSETFPAKVDADAAVSAALADSEASTRITFRASVVSLAPM